MFSSVVNEISITKINETTGKTVVYDGYHNELLNSFETVRTNLPSTIKCYIGTSAAPTVPTMTALVAKLPVNSPAALNFSSIPTNVAIDYKNDFVKFTLICQYEYSLGAVQATVREVGFSLNNSSGTNDPDVMTRAVLTREGFDGVVAGADDRLIVNYTLNFIVSLRKYVFNTNVDRNGTMIPTTVTIQPYAVPPVKSYLDRFIGMDDIDYGFLWSSNVMVSDTPNTTGSTWKEDSVLQETVPGNIKSTITPLPDHQLGVRVTVPASAGNFQKGLAIIAYNEGFISFDPPLLKDADSTLSLDVHFRNKLPSPERIAILAANIDSSIPVFDLNVDVGNRTFRDSQNFLTDGNDGEGIYQNIKGIEGVQFTNYISRNLNYASRNVLSIDPNRTTSARFVFYMSHRAHSMALFAEQDAWTPTRGYMRGLYSFRLQGSVVGRTDLTTEHVYLNGSYAGAGVANLFDLTGRWIELIVHHVAGKTTIYINGTVAYQSSHPDYSARTVFAAYNKKWVVFGNPKIQDDPIDGIYLNHVSYYDNHLVSPMGLPALKTVTYPRTLLLLTFENGLPTNTDSFKLFARGTVTVEPTGGPGGIPAVNIGTGSIYIFSSALTLYGNEEFTLEFEGFFTTTTYNVFITDRSYLSEAISGGTDRGRCEVFPSTSPWSPHSGNLVGSVSQSPFNTWASWTVVRRLENGVFKYYVCKNGVVVATRTYEATNYNTCEFLGWLGIGNTGTSLWTNPSNNFKLANIRLTKGVIEYFNPAGFSIPTGLRTTLV